MNPFEMPLSERMSPQPVTLEPKDTLTHALEILEKYSFRHFPVLEGNELVGFLSDRDLYLATGTRDPLVSRFRHPDGREKRVEEIMQQETFTASPDDSLQTAAALMVDQRIGALPVVEGERLVGIVTETDLLGTVVGAARWQARSGKGDQVRDLMQPEVHTIPEDTDLLETIQVCLDQGIRHIPVTRDGVIRGILSDRDLRLGLARLMREDQENQATGNSGIPMLSAGKAAQYPVLSTTPESPISAAAALMLNEKVGALLVMSEGKCEGILCQSDLLRHYAVEMENAVG